MSFSKSGGFLNHGHLLRPLGLDLEVVKNLVEGSKKQQVNKHPAPFSGFPC